MVARRFANCRVQLAMMRRSPMLISCHFSLVTREELCTGAPSRAIKGAIEACPDSRVLYGAHHTDGPHEANVR